MSYILDALRRADAERARGSVPGLNAQPMKTGSAATTRVSAERSAPLSWIVVGGAMLIALGAALWFAFNRGAGDQRNEAAVASSAPAAASPTIAAPAAPIVVAPATPTPQPSVTAAPSPPQPVIIATPAPRPRPAASAALNPQMANATNSQATPPGTANAASAAPKVYAIAELPDDIRRQLPEISVGGSAYSSVKADRLLIVNGQVLHEGDAVVPGVVLEQIRVKAAVLAFRGYRYTLPF